MSETKVITTVPEIIPIIKPDTEPVVEPSPVAVPSEPQENPLDPKKLCPGQQGDVVRIIRRGL